MSHIEDSMFNLSTNGRHFECIGVSSFVREQHIPTYGYKTMQF